MKITNEDKFNYIKNITDVVDSIKLLVHCEFSDKVFNKALTDVLNLLDEQISLNYILIKNQIMVINDYLEDEDIFEELTQKEINDMKVMQETLELERKRNRFYKKALHSD